MSLDDLDFEALTKGILDDLKGTGEAFWDQLNDEQRPIIEAAGKSLAKASLGLITDPDNADIYQELILAAKVSIGSVTVIAALDAQERLKSAVQSALKKLVGVGLALL